MGFVGGPGGVAWSGGRREGRMLCRRREKQGNGVPPKKGGNGVPPKQGNGVPPSEDNGGSMMSARDAEPLSQWSEVDDEWNEDEKFIIGYPVEKLQWCAATTEVEDGLLESRPTMELMDDVCNTEIMECNEKMLTPRSMTPYFVDTFRMSSVYINLFRDTTFVIHVPGAVVEEPLFESIMEDIALLSIVGIRLVLVLGPKRQIERRMQEITLEEKFSNGVRVTDESMLRIIKEATGSLLFEIESKLSRGVVNVPTRNKISLVSGNFYTAQPIGVIDGTDFGFTGKVRRIDVEAIERRLEMRDIVILSNIAFSPSGEAFNCQSEAVAGACAAQLKAEKLIYLGSNEVLYHTGTKSMVPNLPLRTAKQFMKENRQQLPVTFHLRLSESIKALSAGVRRAHILNRFVDGVLIMEIFHRDGVGIMISRDLYEGVRPAQLKDLPGIFEIIEPLMRAKVLVPRTREQMESEISKMVVAERDGMVIAVAMLDTFADSTTMAELSCFAVHPRYRGSGKGGSLLSYVERVAFNMGIRDLFLLSTQSFAWFRERYFFEVSVDVLPDSRKAKYNRSRNSKVLMKKLVAVDELEELLIQVQDDQK